VASKSAQQEPEKAEVIEEMLDLLDTTLDRVKVLYEQYFLGIQKQPPTHLHNDVERKLRDLSQLQVRNTALRYRLATLAQKFGSYNSYWRRTLRQIENGTYVRSLSKVGRQAARSGEAIPEEILAAMPKLMREQVRRDREHAVALAKHRGRAEPVIDASDGIPIFEDEDGTQPFMPDEPVAVIAESTELRAAMRASSYVVNPADVEMDLDAFFAEVEAEVSPEPPVNPETGVRFRTPTNQAPSMRPLPAPPGSAPSQVAKPNPIAPGASVIHGAVPVESMAGPFARTPVPGRMPSMAVPKIPADPGARTPAPGRIPSMAVPRIPSDPGARTPAPIRASSDPGARTPAPIRASSEPGARPPFGPRPITEPGVQPARPVAQYPASSRPVTPAASVTPSEPSRPVEPPRPAEPPRPIAQYPEPHHAQPRPRAAPPVAASSRPTADGPRNVAPPQRPSQPRAAASRPEQPPPQRPPAGMTDADVNALYARYVSAKEMVGEKAGPGSYGKLLKTINAQAPKIMEQYKAKGVDFTIVVKDNQVIIRAKPKL
jgi:hypothetical protein